MNAVGIIILAAGASRRMGQPKQRLHYRGRGLLRNAVSEARRSRCGPIVVVLGAHAPTLHREVAIAHARGAIEVVAAPRWRLGMSESLKAGLAMLGDARAMIVMPADQPFVTAPVIDRLIARWQRGNPLLVASEYRSGAAIVHGAPALFSRRLFPELARLRGAAGARRVIRRHEAQAATVAAPEAALDVDTPSDYQALRKPLHPFAQERAGRG